MTVTVGWLGTVAGALYMPDESIVPTDVFPPGIEFTCQLTAELEAFCTIALNCTLGARIGLRRTRHHADADRREADATAETLPQELHNAASKKTAKWSGARTRRASAPAE